MNWIIDEKGRAHCWERVISLYPNDENTAVIMETDDYRQILCTTDDPARAIRRILERASMDRDVFDIHEVIG